MIFGSKPMFTVAIAAVTLPAVGLVSADRTSLEPIVLHEDGHLVVWTNVHVGLRPMPTITIDESIYPDEQGVQFVVNGDIDDRDPRARPDGRDATGPRDDSEFHIFPRLRLIQGYELLAQWTDELGRQHASTHVVGTDVDPDAELVAADQVEWRDVDPGRRRQPIVAIDAEIYPNARGVQFFVDGEPDDRSRKARPDGWDATGPTVGSQFHVFPNIRLRDGQRVEARWVDAAGSAHRSIYVVGNGMVTSVPTAPPSTTAAPTTQAPPPTPTTTAPATTEAPTTTQAPPTTPAPTTTEAPTTTQAPPTTLAPTTTEAPTTPPPPPDVDVASWTDVAPGGGRLPTVSIRDEAYPDGRGVQFRVNGEVDDRHRSARPDGWDATGPQDDSTFHIYPVLSLSPGDALEARWTDRSGRAHQDVHVVAAAPATPPPAPSPTPTTAPPPAPTPPPAVDQGDRPGPSTTGPRTALTRTFTSATIDDAWLAKHNGGSRVIEGVHFKTSVLIRTDNVTIRNFKVTTGSRYGIENDVFSGSPTSGLVLEDGEITGPSSSGLLVSNAVVRRLEIHHVGADAVKPFRNVVIEDSWFHHLGSNAGSHSDGVQMVSGGDVTVRGNYFDMPKDTPGFTNSQCFMIAPNNGPINDVVIDGNWINGGSISVQIHRVGGRAEVTNNRFGRDYRFGLFSTTGPVVKSGNVWDDTGRPI